MWAVRLHTDTTDSPYLVASRNGLVLRGRGDEVIPGSRIYKMVDANQPEVICDGAGGDGDIVNDLSVADATRQTIKSWTTKRMFRYTFRDPL
jgi:hypothetical protein